MAADDTHNLAANSRVAFLGAAVLVFAITAVGLAPAQWPLLIWHACVDGGPLLAWLVAAWGIGLHVTAKEEDDALRHVTAAAIGLGAMSIALLGLGVAGQLNRPAAHALIATGLLLAVVRIRTIHKTTLAWLNAPPAPATWLALLAVPPIACAAVGALVLPGILWGADDPAGYDVVAYHLQMPREWFELGRVTTLPHNVFSFFPLNVEMQYLLAMHLRGGPFDGMILAQLMHTAYVGLTTAAVWAIARPPGALAASVAAIVTACVPWTAMLGSVAYNEGGLMLYATLSIGLALRGRWALAGACAGFAAGCKPTGAACVLVPLAMLISGPLPRLRGRAREGGDGAARDSDSPAITEADARSIAPPPSPLPQAGGGAVVRSLVMFALFALLTLVPWLFRTAVAAHGNPIFPLAMHTLGHGGFDDGQIERFVAAHSPRPDQQSIEGRLNAFWQQVGGDYHFGTIAECVPLWLALIVPAAWLARRDRAARALVVLLVGNVIVWLVATHLQGRFLAHAVPIVGLLIAFAASDRSTAFAAIAICVSVLSFAATFPFRMLIDRATLIGLPSPVALRDLFPPDVAAAIYDSDRPLVLIGDAKAFWYAVPQGRLRYRSVFDVPSDRSFPRAWLGDDVPADALAIVDAGELERFERTYRRLPAMPEAWRGRGVFVVPAKALLEEGK